MHLQIAGRLTGRISKWLVLVFWLLLVGGLAPFAGKLTDVLNNEQASWLPDSAESTKALQKLDVFQDPNAIPTVIVFEKKSGSFAPTDLAALAAHNSELAAIKGVSGDVIGPIPAKDGKAAQTIVTFNLGKNGWNAMPDIAKEVRQITKTDGVSVHLTGAGGFSADSAEAFAGLDSTLLFTTVGVIILILLIVYRSPTLWMLPLFCVGIALTIAQAVIYLLAKGGHLTVNGQSQGILTVLVLGVGTDYALLLIARYREELRRHEDRHEAMAFALHRAAPAIFASGGTVILGMLCLLLADLNSTKGLGPVAAIGVGIGLLVMMTLLPAILVICGRWVFWPKRPTFGSAEPTRSGLWSRVADKISLRPRPVWIITSLVLGVCALGLLKLDPTGLSIEQTYTHEVDSVVGQKVLTKHGLADQSTPVMVVAKGDRINDVVAAMQGLTGLGPASTPVVKGDVGFVTAPTTSDLMSEASFATVQRVRDAVGKVSGAEALVGGSPAIQYDYEKASTRDDYVVMPAILLVVLLILILLLRSILSPLLLIATVVVSFAAALGLSTLLFQVILGFTAADASVPLLAFVFLVALGIDYNIFLMTRVREETQEHGTREGSKIALAATGGVITSAGCVLAATFLVLCVMPLSSFVQIGVIVALGVILDTMVVRSVLVTALNLDLGSRIWWPSKLDRSDQSPEMAMPERVL